MLWMELLISPGVYLYISVLHSSTEPVNETLVSGDSYMLPTFLEDEILQVHSQ